MSRIAKALGWLVFAVALVGVGLIAFGLLSVRSPLADGTLAAGPDRQAWVVVGIAVAVGAVAAGLLTAAVTEGIVRLWRAMRG